MYCKSLTEIFDLLKSSNIIKDFKNIKELKENLLNKDINQYIYGFKNIERFLNFDYQYNGLHFNLFGRNYTIFKMLEKEYSNIFETKVAIYNHNPSEKNFSPSGINDYKRLHHNQYYHLKFKIDYQKDKLKFNDLYLLLEKLAKEAKTSFIIIGKHLDLNANFLIEITAFEIKTNYIYFQMFKSQNVIKDLLFALAILAYSYSDLNDLKDSSVSFLLTEQQLNQIIKANNINYNFNKINSNQLYFKKI